MKVRPATSATTHAGGCHLLSSRHWTTWRGALAFGLPLLMLAACSSQPPKANLARTNSMQTQSDTCAPTQLALGLDAGDGRFDGMSHSGTMLVLRNTGTTACTISAQPSLTFTDADQQTLEITTQSPSDTHPAPAPITLAPGASVTSDIRWISGNVYDNGHCESPAHVSLAIGKQQISAAFAGRLCGADGKSSIYTATAFKPANEPAPAAEANVITYHCDDHRTVKAAYPDHDTAVLTFDGHTHHLRTARSADGARYVSDHWQWWTKGMHEG
jgi:membrane-bound inhibitor of C-type lysozyme